MKSAKKVRVPRNKKITPKRKRMRSKPRKQRNKIKHIGGAEEAPTDNFDNCIKAIEKNLRIEIKEPRRDTLKKELKADCTRGSMGVCRSEDNKCVPIPKTNNN
tara:strand:- start:73 stop:381 length:309 start_codon:yes stop_codon:yes gene_type:complete